MISLMYNKFSHMLQYIACEACLWIYYSPVVDCKVETDIIYKKKLSRS